ncbi:AMP-binding protein [Actinoplanes sp. NPDC049118]|uniref:AMP-binding protein n=1 Tax=Actinoplanes sp. NPDC049118 TaxID=3155769 RepID=UPI0033E5EE44
MAAAPQYLRIVVNAEHRYGLWPFARRIPPGWVDTYFVGSRLRCLAQITELTRQHGPEPAASTGGSPDDGGRTVTGRLDLVTALAPRRAAVLGAGRPLTFAGLDRRAGALARTIAEHGVRPGELVGLRLRPGADAVVARLAVLRAGAAYLPMRDGSPPAQPGLRLIVAEPEWAGPARRHGLPVLAWKRRDRAGGRRPARAGRAVEPGDPAYVVPGPAPGGGLVFDHGRLVLAATATYSAGGPLPTGGPAECAAPSPECDELVIWGQLLHGDPVRFDGQAVAAPSGAGDPDELDGRWYVLDDDLHPVTEGQLYFAAAWLGGGYRGGPTRTARWLRPDPFDRTGGRTMLWTGHRARRVDGVLRLADP